ncbi:uncharacterized protein MONBRDRAFT_14014 [Monosiga brevicollis MX1]|uniref:alpha-amylase n=1 Tax=Monosiga brevicollis TaxID=81824 RepID=A9UP40_MONBE|nr:uncharacterized protein MONBRDRAFT_14014 [Monosiga brevicollis MX1]EDQ92354.1 predicted protein [Monosiga brevicollis MX1]|eukprot:XP_001742116.1 hypothetical protein [Monosiga brevicollis MX1]
MLAVGYVLLALSALAVGGTHAATADQWRREVIYQILTDRFANPSQPTEACADLSTYCGGTWAAGVPYLDYIRKLGATAVWISPIPDNTDGGYHGYWQQNMSRLNANFGDANGLTQFVEACHKLEIKVMLDVVINHVGNQDSSDHNDFHQFYPFNSVDHYHSYCIIQDFTNLQQVQLCRLSGLPDLNQSNTFVDGFLRDWIKSTLQTFGFDGLRYDTVMEVPAAYWASYTSDLGVFTIGEVDDGDVATVAPFQGPLDATLNYPMYWALRHAFQEKQSMWGISTTWKDCKASFQDTKLLGLFVDNHDNPRFLNINSDSVALANALAWILFAEGIPIIYYGTEQGFSGGNDPANREDLWRSGYQTSNAIFTLLTVLTTYRNTLPDSFFQAEQLERYVMDDLYVFVRGQVIVATTNGGNGHSTSASVPDLPFANGTRLIDIVAGKDAITVNNGTADIVIDDGACVELCLAPSPVRPRPLLCYGPSV